VFRETRNRGINVSVAAVDVEHAAAEAGHLADEEGDARATSLTTSVGKALGLLDALASGAPFMGVSELARRADLPKSTAYRLLSCLVDAGYVDRRGTEYCLGRRLFELGNQIAYCRPMGLRDVALPYLSELYERTHHIVHLAVLEGADVLYLEKLFGHDPTRAPSHVGRRVPAACCGLGKAMLAYSSPQAVQEVLSRGLERRTPYTIANPDLFRQELLRIREHGVAYDREEVAVGLTCVAAPIVKNAHAVAAVSVSGPTSRFDPDTMVESVKRAAFAIADRLY
jgi:IclR family transcriptional regulator, KDG regulon repressor